ncbi:hypothetical protein A0J61_00606 [Choanephora cucurbitarum]|uniref:Uncharacterized protein n=1 Tax=Choanephora cucurbitarum TaxID=101091 RepID=A0A1C7NQF6_9FUNG|nr:hypothetical protein A0J61_00606 [Choanephora cucurbitarum]
MSDLFRLCDNVTKGMTLALLTSNRKSDKAVRSVSHICTLQLACVLEYCTVVDVIMNIQDSS